MAPRIISKNARHGLPRSALFLSAFAVFLAGCGQETKIESAQVRPVRTATAQKSELGELVVLTGQVQAENEAALAFRIGGRIIERSAGVGDHVVPDQVLAKLDPKDELNALRSARAALGGRRPTCRSA